MSQITQKDFYNKYQTIYGYYEEGSSADYVEDEIYYDYKIDFYSHLERVLLKQVHFDDEILNFNLLKTKIEECSETKVEKLLSLIKDNLINSFELDYLKNLIKSLFCWQSQFKNIFILNRIINFIEKNFNNKSSNELIKTIGNYSNTSKNANTLMYAIHSHSIENVSLLIEKYGADLNFIYNNGFTALHYSIAENNIEITEYLLKKSMNLKNYIDFSSLLTIALNESSNFMIHLLLDFHIKNYDNFNNSSRKFERFYLNKNTCSNICKCLIFSRECSLDLKSKIYKLIFEDLNFKLIKLEETLYFILTDSVNHKLLFQYLFDLLQRQLENNNKSQQILYEIIIKHLNNVKNSNWIDKMELLLNYVDDKKSLYNHIIKSNAIDVNETTLYSVKIDLESNIKGYSTKIKHPYFIKQQVLVKYDVIPKNFRLYWLNYFISQWIDLCSLNRSYISAVSTNRYLTVDELINISMDYYEHLIKYGYSNPSDLTYTLDNIRLIDTRKFDARKHSKLNESNKKNFLNLKLICRNKIRQSLSSITDLKLKSLQLPDFLVDILKGEELI
jgi:hypothetical protein